MGELLASQICTVRTKRGEQAERKTTPGKSLLVLPPRLLASATQGRQHWRHLITERTKKTKLFLLICKKTARKQTAVLGSGILSNPIIAITLQLMCTGIISASCSWEVCCSPFFKLYLSRGCLAWKSSLYHQKFGIELGVTTSIIVSIKPSITVQGTENCRTVKMAEYVFIYCQ